MGLEAGARIGPYRVEETIGRGAMGTVYRAHHVDLQRVVAIKVLDGVVEGLANEGRFRREAMAIAQLRHPNVLTLHDFGEVDGRPYMVLEYAPGSLADLLRNGESAAELNVIAMLRGIAAGIDYAHEQGIVHRDIKPANVLIAADGNPMLADFGLVKLMQGAWTMTTDGMATGTPAYMAPEQVNGQAGAAADRYSFATIAYQLLTGQTPFDGALMEILYAQVHHQPKPASALRPDLPASVDAVLAKGLAKQPTDRWSSCGEMVDALDRALAGEKVAVSLPVVSPADEPETDEQVRRRRRLLPLLAMGLFCATIAALLGMLALLHPGPTSSGLAGTGTLLDPTATPHSTGSPSPSNAPPTRRPGDRNGAPSPSTVPSSSPVVSLSTPTPSVQVQPTPRATPTPTPTPTATPTPTPTPQAPGQPTGVTAIGTSGHATVSWIPPTSGAAVNRYVIAASNGQTWEVDGGKTSDTFSMEAGTYQFRVRAVSSSGVSGQWSTWSAPAVVLP